MSNIHDKRITAIVAYCRLGDHVRLRKLLESTGDPQHVRCHYAKVCECSGMHDAVAYGHIEVLRVLSEFGWDLSARCLRHGSCLHQAVCSQHTQMVQALLDLGVNTEVEDSRYDTPVVDAAGRGFSSLVELLLDRGAETRIDPDVSLVRFCPIGRNILTAAVDSCVEHCLLTVLKRTKGSVDGLDRCGANAMSRALAWRRDDFVRILLDHGASACAIGAHGRTPLAEAAVLGYEWGVRELVRRGAPVDGRIADGSTALHAVVRLRRPEEGLRALLEAGASLDVEDAVGDTPLSLAVKLDAVEALAILLERGASPNSKGALTLALAREKWRCGAMLLTHGADPNAEAPSGDSALHIVCSHAHLMVEQPRAMALLLLMAGANPMAKDRNGTTPLDLVAWDFAFCADIAGLLVAFGATRAASPPVVRERAELVARIVREVLEEWPRAASYEGVRRWGYAGDMQAPFIDVVLNSVQRAVHYYESAVEEEAKCTQALAKATSKMIIAVSHALGSSSDVARYGAIQCIAKRQAIVEKHAAATLERREAAAIVQRLRTVA